MAKPLQAGNLDRTVELFHRDNLPSPQRDGTGDIVTLDNEAYATIKAKKEDANGASDTEKDLQNRPTAVAHTVFTIRFRADVRATDLLICDGVSYDVKSVAEGEGRLQWTIITAQRHD